MIHRIGIILRRKGSYTGPKGFGGFTEFGSVTCKIAVFIGGGGNVQYMKCIFHFVNFVTKVFLVKKYLASFGQKTTTNACGPHIKCPLFSSVHNVNWHLSTDISKTLLSRSVRICYVPAL
jgi:hypothetical protein